MINHPIISVERISKAYSVYKKPTDLFREIITRQRFHDVFWALKDISFSIREKQRVGIVGPNGSGKTTLLRLIAGNLQPTSGTIEVRGRVSAMLSLTSILNPEETGLNNIRFNLILNGCEPSEISKLTEEIVEFTELGPFIYSPVKTYSSGMNARLAFAITTAIKPEILAVDEVLSVGDGYFVQKAMKRMLDLCAQGKALVFVSHAINAIQMLCDHVIWLDNGTIRNMGPADYILKLYEEDFRKHQDETTRPAHRIRKSKETSFLHPTELAAPALFRIRILPEHNDGRFKDTHYIRNMKISGDGIETYSILLGDESNHKEGIFAFLDLHRSEWGRFHSRNGIDCRILTAQSGKDRGGQVLIRKPSVSLQVWRAQFTFEVSSILRNEQLVVEFANEQSGRWERTTLEERTTLQDGSERITAVLDLPIVDIRQYNHIVHQAQERAKPDVEILDVAVFVQETKAYVIKERDPFEIRVRILANRKTPLVSAHVKIIRSDGVYVFWQPSGWEDGGIRDLEGEATVRFIFRENYFAGGEYQITAVCTAGWGIDLFASCEVFDRKINIYKFLVQREFPELDLGQINVRVPVVIEIPRLSQTEPCA